MSLHTVQWRSEVIQKRTVMRVLVPEGPGPFPAIYLLHGLSADASVWTRFHAIERLMEERPVLVVMPDADRSFYANDPRPGGLAYEDYIACELREYIERVFPVVAARTGRACVGISMGGYGALLLGLKHSNLYCAAASISGSTYFGHDMSARHLDDDVGTLGRALPKEANDLFHLTARGAPRQRPLALPLSCGTEDHLHDTNTAFHQHLAAVHVEHQWIEHPGAHDHGTWDVQLPLALAFAADALGAQVPDL